MQARTKFPDRRDRGPPGSLSRLVTVATFHGLGLLILRDLGLEDRVDLDGPDGFDELLTLPLALLNMEYGSVGQATQDLVTFIQEDPAANQRLSRDFAHAVVSDILESF